MATGWSKVNTHYPGRLYPNGPPEQGRIRWCQRRSPCRDFKDMRKGIFARYPEGSQPTNLETPLSDEDPTTYPEWIRGYGGEPIRKLYRTLSTDMEEVDLMEWHKTYDDNLTMAEFIVQVIAAINNGSNYRSPFVHCSKVYRHANKFRKRALLSKPYIVEIDLVRFYRLTAPRLSWHLTTRIMIDCSNRDAWKSIFIDNNMSRYGDVVKNGASQAMAKSIDEEEVLLLPRGFLHPDCLSVLHRRTGKVMNTFREVLKAGGYEAYLMHEKWWKRMNFKAQEYVRTYVRT